MLTNGVYFMSALNEISFEDYKLVEGVIEKQDSFFKEQLIALSEPLKLSPLKSVEQQEKERLEFAEKIINFRKDDLKKGFDLFLEASQGEQASIFQEILMKAKSLSLAILEGKEATYYLTEQDFEWLDKIAEHQFSNHKYEEASCMFRFIIHLNCFFAPAWVGWANSEKNLSHLEVVEQIYDMAMEFFPDHFYLVLFASEFYVYYDKKDKAISILSSAKKKLIDLGMESSKSFQAIQNSLSNLGQ
jgi:hypothetical protein